MLYVVAFLHLLSAPPQNHRFNAVLRARAGRTIGETPSLYRIMTVRRCFFAFGYRACFYSRLNCTAATVTTTCKTRWKENKTLMGLAGGCVTLRGLEFKMSSNPSNYWNYFLKQVKTQLNKYCFWISILRWFLEKQIGKLRVNNFDLFAAICISKFMRKMEWKVKCWSMNSFWNSFIYLVNVPFRSSPNSHYRRL